MKRRRKSTSTSSSVRPVLGRSDLPHLAAFLDGYLHEDFALDYASPSDALSAFLREGNRDERAALAADWRRFAEQARGVPWRTVRTAWGRMGGSWRPATPESLHALFERLEGAPGEAAAATSGHKEPG